MSSTQEYRELLTRIADQKENWSVTSQQPFIISRQKEENTLPISIRMYGNENKVHLFYNLYSESPLTELAQKFLRLKDEGQIQQKNEEAGLVIMIDEDGFAVVYDASGEESGSFEQQFDAILDNAEAVLLGVVKTAHETVENAPEQALQVEDSTTGVDAPQSIADAVEQYLEEKDYSFKHDEDKQRFIFGFSTDNYINIKGDASLRIVINYSDSDLLRFETPWLYEFDLNKTEYSLISMAIAWFQFEYKFLSMSLDPRDGELKISIDIPLGKGTLHTTQIHRLVTFILQFTERTYDELFSLMLKDSEAAEVKLKGLIDNYKAESENHQWIDSIKDKLGGITEDQRKAIEEILSNGADDRSQGGI